MDSDAVGVWWHRVTVTWWRSSASRRPDPHGRVLHGDPSTAFEMAWQQVALGLCSARGRSWRRWLCHQVHIDYFKTEADDPLYKPGEGSLVGQLGAEGGRIRACGDLAVVELRAQRSADLAAESDLIRR